MQTIQLLLNVNGLKKEFTLIKPMKFVSFYANHTAIAQCQWIDSNETHEIRPF